MFDRILFWLGIGSGVGATAAIVLLLGLTVVWMRAQHRRGRDRDKR